MAEASFLDSFARGVDQTQLMAYSFAEAIGDLTGFDTLQEWGQEGIVRNLQEIAENPPTVETWDDVDGLASFFDYVVERLGEQAPNLLAVLIPGLGAGAVAARTGAALAIGETTKAVIGKALKRKIGYKAFDNFAKRKAASIAAADVAQLGANVARMGGIQAGSFVLNTGETSLVLADEGINDPVGAILAGAGKSVLDVIGLERLVRAGKALNVRPTDVGKLAKNVLKEAGIVGSVEGVTEGMQTVVDLMTVKAHDPFFQVFSPDNLKEIREAVLVGGITGGTFGGGVAAIRNIHDYQAEKAENQNLKDIEDAYTRYRLTIDTDGEMGFEEELDYDTSSPAPPPPDAPPLTPVPPIRTPQDRDVDDFAQYGVIDDDAYGDFGEIEAEPGEQISPTIQANRQRLAETRERRRRRRRVEIPESQATIDAQNAEEADPTTGRIATIATPGTPAPSDFTAQERPVVDSATGEVIPGYRIYSHNPQLLARVDAVGGALREDELGILLGRPQGKAGSDGLVIVATNSDGVPTFELASSAETLAEDIDAVAAQTGPTDMVRVSDASTVIAERLARTARAGANPTNEEVVAVRDFITNVPAGELNIIARESQKGTGQARAMADSVLRVSLDPALREGVILKAWEAENARAAAAREEALVVIEDENVREAEYDVDETEDVDEFDFRDESEEEDVVEFDFKPGEEDAQIEVSFLPGDNIGIGGSEGSYGFRGFRERDGVSGAERAEALRAKIDADEKVAQGADLSLASLDPNERPNPNAVREVVRASDVFPKDENGEYQIIGVKRAQTSIRPDDNDPVYRTTKVEADPKKGILLDQERSELLGFRGYVGQTQEEVQKVADQKNAELTPQEKEQGVNFKVIEAPLNWNFYIDPETGEYFGSGSNPDNPTYLIQRAVGEDEVFRATPDTYLIQTSFLPKAISAEENISPPEGDGVIVTPGTRGTFKSPIRSATAFWGDAISRARDRGRSVEYFTERALKAAASTLERLQTGEPLPTDQPYVHIARLTPDGEVRTKKVKGKEVPDTFPVHIGQLANSGREFNNRTGYSTEAGLAESLLDGLMTSLNMLRREGYSVNQFFEKVQKPERAEVTTLEALNARFPFVGSLSEQADVYKLKDDLVLRLEWGEDQSIKPVVEAYMEQEGLSREEALLSMRQLGIVPVNAITVETAQKAKLDRLNKQPEGTYIGFDPRRDIQDEIEIDEFGAQSPQKIYVPADQIFQSAGEFVEAPKDSEAGKPADTGLINPQEQYQQFFGETLEDRAAQARVSEIRSRRRARERAQDPRYTEGRRADRQEAIATAASRQTDLRSPAATLSNRSIAVGASPVTETQQAVAVQEQRREDLKYVTSLLAELGSKIKGAFANNFDIDVIDFANFDVANLGYEEVLKQLRDAGSIPSDLNVEEFVANRLNNPDIEGSVYTRIPATPEGKVKGIIFLNLRDADRDSSVRKAMRRLVLGHEVGHMVFKALTSAEVIPPHIRSRLEAIFEKAKASDGAPQQWFGANGFEEFFVDMLSARYLDKQKGSVIRDEVISAHPWLLSADKGIVRQYLDKTLDILEKIWEKIKSQIPKRFHSNKDFSDVIQQMKEADIFSDNLLLTPVPAFMDDVVLVPSSISENVSRATLQNARKWLRESLDRAYNTRVGRRSVGWYLGTTDGQLRSKNRKLADMIHSRPGETRKGGELSYHTGVSLERKLWAGKLSRALGGANEAQLRIATGQLARDLPDGQITALARRLRTYLRQYYEEYLKPRIQDLGFEEDYFPHSVEVHAVATRPFEFIETLVESGIYNEADAAFLADRIVKPPLDSAEEGAAALGKRYWQLERKIKDPELIQALVDRGFYNQDPLQGFFRYLNDTTRAAEYHRVFGGWVDQVNLQGEPTGKQVWNPSAKLQDILDWEHERDRVEVANLVAASIFPKHFDPNNPVHRALSELKAYESFRTLMFSGVASIPEVGGVFLRAKGEIGLTEFARAVGDTIKNWDDVKDAMEVLAGSVHPVMSAGLLTEIHAESPDIGHAGFFRRYLPQLFRFNGNNKLVEFTRVLSNLIAQNFIELQANKIERGENVERSTRYLKELGINDHQIVLDWIKAGRPAWADIAFDPNVDNAKERDNARNVVAAMSRFTDESVINPNASQRPSWVQHPLGAMVFHLKTFSVSFNKVILGGLLREMANRADEQGGLKYSAKDMRYIAFLASSMFLFLALGGISDEIRQRIKSLGMRGTFARQGYDPEKVLAAWADRSGFLSLPYFDLFRGSFPESGAFLAGPTAHHTYELLTRLPSETSSKALLALEAVPGLSQLPQLRSELR